MLHEGGYAYSVSWREYRHLIEPSGQIAQGTVCPNLFSEKSGVGESAA
jgi:hypothetical protein